MKNVDRCLLIVVNDPAFFLSHRLPIAIAARDAGYQVHVATKAGEGIDDIRNKGINHHTIPLSRSGHNPFEEMSTILSIWRLIKRIRPDIIHLVTIKPVLYGGLIARLSKVPGVVIAISGLGSVFNAHGVKAGFLRGVARFLYRLVLGHPNMRAIFQNPEDRKELLNIGVLEKDRTVMIRGSGVSLNDYEVKPEPNGRPVVVFAARLVKDKGIYEFVEAARLIHSRGVHARFQIVGAPDPASTGSVTDSELEKWRQEKIVELLGFVQNIPKLFSTVNIITLPSYHEGLPKVLIEAAASGRAVVTTDHPGCRYAIEPDTTGLVVPIRDSVALANAIQRLIEDEELRHRMGQAGRELAVAEFNIDNVVNAHLNIYKSLVKAS